MKLKKYLPDSLGVPVMVFFAAIILAATSYAAYAAATKANGAGGSEKRSDVIIIDSMKSLGPLERPPVAFFHDEHTAALKKKNKNCSECHPKDTDKKRLSTKFKRLSDDGYDKKSFTAVYHENCLDCHKTMSKAGDESGPLLCGECHKRRPESLSAGTPISFDKSLHFRHVKAKNEKCEACHHEYDKKQKKLFYAKGGEGSCRYCHGDVKKENRIALRDASHLACVACHQKALASNNYAGPVECAGCHDAKMRQKIKKVEKPERFKRNQPDFALIKLGEKDLLDKSKAENRMSFVPFAHKTHEEKNDSCRKCHHKDLQACNKCHTLTGSKEGDGVNLGQSMHDLGGNASCLGCHELQKKAKDCSGCHVKGLTSEKSDKDFCGRCHMDSSIKAKAGRDDKKVAEAMLATRTFAGKLDAKDIPEKVVIKAIADKYEPVEFPHKKVVDSLYGSIEKSGLAKWFHATPDTMCQGCHHNAPMSKSNKPPLCGSCHGKKASVKGDMSRPSIVGAYHGQCMGCHKEMGVKKPMGCTECHAKKK